MGKSIMGKSIMGKSGLSGSITGSFGSKANSSLSAKQAIVNGVRCSFKRFYQNRNITFSKKELARLKEV